MIHHQYQSVASRIFNLPSWQWYGALTLAVTLAGLSVVRPVAIRPLFIIAGRKLRRALRFKRKESGIEIAGEWIPDSARLRHTHIVGATGTGKTVLLELLIYAEILRGHGMMIIDPKGDRELYERVKEFCRKVGRGGDLRFLSATHADESARWNPCRLGNASELQSKWFNSGVYNEPHYAKACELGLLQAFNALLQDKGKEGFGLSDLVDQLRTLAQNSKSENMLGLFLDLQNLSEGEWGQILNANHKAERGKQRQEISLLDITRKNEILFVDLPTEAKAVQSSRMGKLLLQELMLISGLRKIYPGIKTGKPFSIFVDEFDAFANPSFSTFLNKARSSDFMIHIAHQTLSDLKKVSPEFAGQLLGNTNVRYIFRQDDPDDAETWARYFGTKMVTKSTYQNEYGMNTGRSSQRETQEFKIHPDLIKSLKIGECIFSVKTEDVLRAINIPFSRKAKGKTNIPSDRGPSGASDYSSYGFDSDVSEMSAVGQYRKADATEQTKAP
ncbi:TraM recognition domain-containing protein [Bdellovibrionota bacterium FG-2]